jgi:hypothetical protein
MYWPIGAPRVYAASKQELSALHDSSTTSSDEDAADPIQINTTQLATEQAIDDDEDELEERKPTAGTTKAPGKQAAKPAAAENKDKTGFEPEDDPGGEIVGLRVSRSGHIFATITRSTLTIWQTKVRSVQSV